MLSLRYHILKCLVKTYLINIINSNYLYLDANTFMLNLISFNFCTKSILTLNFVRFGRFIFTQISASLNRYEIHFWLFSHSFILESNGYYMHMLYVFYIKSGDMWAQLCNMDCIDFCQISYRMQEKYLFDDKSYQQFKWV